VGLNGTLLAPINTTPITKDGLYSTWSYTQALELAKITDPEQRKKRADAGAVTLETIKSSVKLSASEFYEISQANLEIILSELNILQSQLVERCGDTAPQTGSIERTIQGVITALNTIAKDILNPAVAMTEDDNSFNEATSDETDIHGDSSAMPEFKASGNIKTRLEAFKILQNIADFFKRTEPHSPVGYTIERVVRWGDMSLPELLRELIPDPQSKDYYEKLVGILPPPAPDLMQNNPGGMPPMQQNMYNPDPYQNNMMGNDMYGGGYAPPPGGYEPPLFK
jgi:type VI secretion system protein ImpA